MSAISIGLIVVAIALAVFVGVRGYYWYCEGKKLQTSGYMTPASTKLARWTFKAVANVGTRLLVGPVTVIGRENSFYKGRGLVLPNHVITHDFIVVGKTMPYGYRQLSKAAEIKNPVVATLAAWIGTVGVQVEGGKAQDGGGQAVVDTGAKIITASPGSRMLLFPQGMLTYTGDISPKTFRTGATRMLAKAASEINGERPHQSLDNRTPNAVHVHGDGGGASIPDHFGGARGESPAPLRCAGDSPLATTGQRCSAAIVVIDAA